VVAFDGNGNVSALVNAADGTPVANYEYGPFGEVIRSTGPMAKVNPMRFATKYQDDESDLLYYDHRFYNASTGRWLSRDPIEEQGGVNLYGFVGNNPNSFIDILGMDTGSTGWNLFNMYAGFGSTGLTANDMLDVINSEEVQGFKKSLISKAKAQWTCGKSGKFFLPFTDMSFYPGSPDSNPDLSFARSLDWGLTGKWQLIMGGECSWKCKACGFPLLSVGSDAKCNQCQCKTECKIKWTISKYYTFVYVPGGNVKNIGTTVLLYPFNYLGETFIIDEPFDTTGLDVGTQSCFK
jgi:RHS repeat-associated protein